MPLQRGWYSCLVNFQKLSDFLKIHLGSNGISYNSLDVEFTNPDLERHFQSYSFKIMNFTEAVM